MLKEWEQIVPDERSKELDIWPQFQKLTSDMISRTAFGSSYEEGRRIFELQKEQAEIIMKQFNSIYIPGSRYVITTKVMDLHYSYSFRVIYIEHQFNYC